MMNPVVSIVIVNWNGRERVLRCLKCIHALDYPHRCIQLIVVDNGSSDRSQTAIRKFLQRWRKSYLSARLLILPKNVGVPSAMNSALAHLHPGSSYVWKLDNDITFPRNYLSLLVERIDREGRNKVGGIGGALMDLEGVDQSAGAVFKSFPKKWLSMLHYRTARELIDCEVVMIMGGSCVFPTNVFEKHGTFDERFFLCYDETEFCLRLVKAGRPLLIEPNAVAVHSIVSSGDRRSSRWIYFMTRNHLLLGRCYFKGVERTLFYVLQACSLPWKYFRMVVQGRLVSRVAGQKAFLSAYYDFVRGRFGAGSLATTAK